MSPTDDGANGFSDLWSNASGAYSNGGSSATESDGDRHHYYTFNFSIPDGSTIDGIEVKADAWSSDSSGCSFGFDLSWNGGSSWSNQKTTSLNSSETTYTFGGSADLWGAHDWEVNDFTNGNFRVRVDSIAPGSCSGTRYLDWIRTKVYYTEPAPIEIVALQLTSASPTNTIIAELTEGFEINLDTHGTNLTIVAETDPMNVGSVRFNLDAGTHQKTENIFPYSIMGDTPAGNFAPMPIELLPLGLHSVTATPYSEVDLGGFAGDPFTINFKVIQNEGTRCEDGIDNDLDTLTDGADPDCAAPPVYECSDGIDNDEDGATDFGGESGDLQCSSAEDNNEGPDACTNIDGDQDGVPPGYYQDGDECFETEGGEAAIMWIYKQTLGLGGAFSFDVSGEGSIVPGDESFELSTEGSEDSDYEKVYVYPDGYNSTFTVTEDLPEGWQLTDISCEVDEDDEFSIEGTSVVLTIDPDSTLTCTFTNTAVAELEIIKQVVNDEGGAAVASDFIIDIENNAAHFETINGSEAGTIVVVEPGIYAVTEPTSDGYERSYSGDCVGSIELGQRKTCTVINTDVEDDDNEGNTTSGSEANPSGSVLGASVDTEGDNTNDQNGSVLGESCGISLTFEQLISIKNGVGANPEIVKVLQEWLNSSQNANLTVNGIYDEATKLSIMKFQESYASDTLSPWGPIKATGNVWLTTAAAILEVAGCGTVELPELVPFTL